VILTNPRLGFKNAISGIADAISPSQAAKSNAYAKSQIAYAIYDGRYKEKSPRTRVGPPVELFHPTFGHFLDEVEKKEDSPPEVIRQTTEYMRKASAIYPSEDKRRDVLSPLLSKILGMHVQMVSNSDKTLPDGVVEFQVNIGGVAITILIEFKNESGDGASDATTQSGLSFARTLVDPKVWITLSCALLINLLRFLVRTSSSGDMLPYVPARNLRAMDHCARRCFH
jgi:hypothetical protein